MIFLAGVCGEDENGPRGNIRHDDDLVAQCEYAFDKIKRVLAAHGANMNVKVTSYLTDMNDRVAYGQCLSRNFGTAPLPTLIGVTSLAFPEMMVETDVTAITPDCNDPRHQWPVPLGKYVWRLGMALEWQPTHALKASMQTSHYVVVFPMEGLRSLVGGTP